MTSTEPEVSAIDLFCGAGGLSRGLQEAGVRVTAGVDLDARCQYPFEANIEAPFLRRNIADMTIKALEPLWIDGTVRVLAGCAPCQPFSSHRRGADTSEEVRWALLARFSDLVTAALPEIVTMENVPRLQSAQIFHDYVAALKRAGYYVDWRSCYGPEFGLAQTRRRLVLLASRLGPIQVPTSLIGASQRTVRDVIGGLPPIAAGECDPADPLHRARRLSDLNLRRIRASVEGGTWEDWPDELRSPCHRRESGKSFRSVYARMSWDAPGPTITTLAHNYGTGRFGHPEQDRALSLREAALLQGFPADYTFVRDGDPVEMAPLGRLIGNAVPPPIAKAIGLAILNHVEELHAK